MAKIESPFDAAMRENARLQARLAIKDATMEPQRVHIRLLQEKNRRLQSRNAELLAACEEAMLEFNDGYTAEGKGIIVEAMASAKESEGE